ncbi:MAG: hypothetical protein EXR72_10860 [Myxococcales bacterium]|nr:hypothetical protein [Myxococcales bacterium]
MKIQASSAMKIAMFLLAGRGAAETPEGVADESFVEGGFTVDAKDDSAKKSGVAFYQANGGGAKYTATAFDKAGRAVTRISVDATQKTRYRATLTGRGATLPVELVVSLGAGGTAKVYGTIAGQGFSVSGRRGDKGSIQRYGGSLVLSSKQQQLLGFWRGVSLPGVLAQASGTDCALAVGGAVLHGIGCFLSAWLCGGLIDSVVDAATTCYGAAVD